MSPGLSRPPGLGRVLALLLLAFLAGCATPRVERPFREEVRRRPESAAWIHGVPAPARFGTDGEEAPIAAVLAFWRRSIRTGGSTPPADAHTPPAAEEDLRRALAERGLWAYSGLFSPDRVKLALRSGVPVLLRLQEQPLRPDAQRWLLTYGFSGERESLLLFDESGRPAERPWNDILRAWRATDHRALVICPPEKPAWPLTFPELASRAQFYERVGDLERAAADYGAAREAAPAPPSLLVALGNVYRQMDRPSEAEPLYREAIRQDPRLARAYNNLAYLLAEEDRGLDEAAGLARQAMILDPANPLIMDTLGLILLKQQKGKEAAEVLERAWGRSQWFPVAVQIEIGQRLVRAHLMNGHEHLAAEVLRDILSMDPGAPVPEEWRRLLPRR